MKKETVEIVHALLKNFAQNSLKDYDVEKLKKAYPFHRLFFDELGLIAFKQERSVVTKMGMHLYPELAKTIAIEKYKDVTREKPIRGNVPVKTANIIDRIVTELRTNQRSPNRKNELAEIDKTFSSTDKKAPVEIRTVADIYIGDFVGGPFFAEIKSPLPNLDVCAETKKKILTFMTLMRGENPKAFLAFPYNPFITRAEYKHGFTNQIMDMSEDILMADEFWDYIGGKGTFDNLLSIIEDVGTEIRKEKS
ncbi:MAG: TdeIII family type II restriction endonuclease [Anaerolineales bacterium]